MYSPWFAVPKFGVAAAAGAAELSALLFVFVPRAEGLAGLDREEAALAGVVVVVVVAGFGAIFSFGAVFGAII